MSTYVDTWFAPHELLITTFFPTSLLWLLAYLTLYITVDDFNDRIMVSVTALLVLAALLSSINGSLPDTSYFKYIDLWFLWYTTIIFCITAFHIFVDTIEHTSQIVPSSQSKLFTQREKIDSKQIKPSKRVAMNNRAKKIVPVIWLIFNLVYFFLQIIQM